MRHVMQLLAVSALLCSCGAKDDQQRAAETATDTRPRGGSMEGAGGAGPGYDGSAQGTGKHGTVPAPGAGFGSALTNSAEAMGARTNSPAPPPSATPPSPPPIEQR